MNRRKELLLLIGAAAFLGCSDSPTAPAPTAAEIDHLAIFVRNWPDDYVEIDFKRQDGKNTFVMFRPPQPGVPRVLIDSVGPSAQDPEEIVELMSKYNVWAMADSNAAGGACSTKSGDWVCNITSNDYSLVLYVVSGGVSRAQRYTRLEQGSSNKTARALGDFVFAMMRKRTDIVQDPDR